MSYRLNQKVINIIFDQSKIIKTKQTLKDKYFRYGITFGLIISAVGYVCLKTNLIPENYSYHIRNIYRLTLIASVVFILLKSLFINQYFDQILKILGVIFLAILGMNLLKEFNIYNIEYIKPISYIMFCRLK